MSSINYKTKTVTFEVLVDGSLQVITNICLYCMGDVYVSERTIECRFETDEQKEHFLQEIDDLDLNVIG